ncbi:hypothetical protein [Pseudomonas sp. URIL14HWK12:I5]|uniref:hypothetical protein n=1 Tax=Pseudomonas sp. URIL14HWK12:I5 TaxID=1261630 RepID=UPI0009D88285|nr:hypothetical protein [Pseudomonas sp. URIL14HWK12:I5]SMD00822.1 hypothetical protein SAMN05660385_03691 [Pseudomonas sp. URIL14HWK12:I5]
MHANQTPTHDLVISVRLSAGTYTARARGEKATASSTISADAAARALASKLGALMAQPDLFAANRCSTDPHVQFTAQRCS